MNKAELRPCPFCGGINIKEEITLVPGEYYFFCDDCGSSGPEKGGLQKAIDAWNHRDAE